MVDPAAVHPTLSRHILLDGFDFVLDTRQSRGATLVDARDGTRYLDLFSFFASAPLGMNHPALAEDPDFLARLTEVAVNKPSNSDVYTTQYAEFVATFERIAGDPALSRLFCVEGGALGVENALKAAFDWKSRRNEAAGRGRALGTRVLHLTHAFHGRTGYTLSLTNTDPVKTDRFPTFDWPRIPTPAVRFPLEEHLASVQAAEEQALEAARAAFERHPHDIACFIVEPILGEGGDHHLRAEFLQAIQALCGEHDALFIADEVQTGGGLTGTMWAYSQLGIEPDLVAFGKKFQVCGVMAGRRVEEDPENVFRVAGRINSTWGGNLTDMVRATRILEVMEAEGLVARAGVLGARLQSDLTALAAAHPDLAGNPRGRGLMCAIDLPTSELRGEALRMLREDERVLMLGSGERALRFRPALVITEDELAAGVAALDRTLGRLADRAPRGVTRDTEGAQRSAVRGGVR